MTFLFTDIEDSTQLWEQHPDAMRAVLARHDAFLRAAIEAHHGRVFKTIGDAFCAAFAEPTDALHAAIAAQRALIGNRVSSVGCRDRGSPSDTLPPTPYSLPPLNVRIVLHTGTAETREGDYFGPTLNRIARLLAVGHGGQVLLSQSTHDLVKHALPPGVALRDLGSYRL